MSVYDMACSTSLDTFHELGYVVLPQVLTKEQIVEMRQRIAESQETGTGWYPNAAGVTCPNFLQFPDLRPLHDLCDSDRIREALVTALSDDYRFCSHNDIGIGRICPWHKDKLNGKYSKYQTIDIWSTHKGEEHRIVKVLIYLQDQHDVETSLWVVPGSHRTSDMGTAGAQMVRLSVGDVLVFDQRITHRGAHKHDPERMLIAFGYGKNNVFTDQFERGTVKRQNTQF